ncbi:MAG: SDR family NAD(P)-dependent oxidoreductase [Solirubrobacteraceae bacterium]
MLEFAVSSPPVCSDAALAIAASRAGALGIVDLQFSGSGAAPLALLARVDALSRGPWAVHVEDEALLGPILEARPGGLSSVVVSGPRAVAPGGLLERVHGAGLRAFAVATCLEEAAAAQSAGADALIAKGHEAGGWIGEEGSFVLLQRLVAVLALPVWVHGGIGLHTVAAAYAAGAAGAVLDGPLLLARESQLPDEISSAVGSMDGSETVTLGACLRARVRVYSRPGLASMAQLEEAERTLGSTAAWRDAVKGAIAAQVAGGTLRAGPLPLGQDAAFAADLASRFRTVSGIITALRAAIGESCAVMKHCNPLAEGAPLAESHGTRYPIVQGPMTRVSDRAEFADAVSQAGALPFLALALMRAPEVDALLRRTRELQNDRPWGVGILGFVPPELRAEQLEVVRSHRPPFALIAGGRPDQAVALEADGIRTYLHVPSPGLLKLYLADGARRFVFEGRECGGHVGPRTSFVLWETMLGVLLDELAAADSDCHVLFAGGIHDARSAAMVAAMAATASDRAIKVGALLGTAYLFTREATERGAITARYQEAALAAGDTVLLESGPGHATRCLHSPFVEQFEAEKRRLRDRGVPAEELRSQLEQLNIGRLRIASKGTERNPQLSADTSAAKLVPVDPAEQWERGMYMIGQVTSLRDRVITVTDLHRDVSTGSSELLDDLAAPTPTDRPAPPPADVAIIGLACILPGAPDLTTFWANVLGKVDAIREVPSERWDWHAFYDADPAARDRVYSRWGGFIDPVEFDPLAMGLPPKSLSSIEPFQLLALITAQAALQDAGYESRPFDRERTSVILGAGGGGADLAVGYTVRSAVPTLLAGLDPDVERRVYDRLPEWTEDSFAGLLMNVAAGRIANRLDFGGTNYTVDAACASSLAAIGLGVRELSTTSSDIVLAGGVDAIQNPFAYLCFSKTHALSPRGRCRPFDASADGIAISEGFSTVVLKRLADAERDGDRIYAVIRGVGAASDGRDRSLTAPRPEGQMRALRRAYAQAGFSPSTVGLVEAHGTGTVAGDGTEVQALSSVFSEQATQRQWCAIGSVKSMIGHTKATAGVAGLTKAALALHHRVLPPTIGVTEPNPKANFPDSPFYVNSEARPWLTGGASHPRRAGVSAFGFGGTDFHIVLEEYTAGYLPEREATVERWPAELLLWRGTREHIAAAVTSLATALTGGAEPSLADLALTLALQAPSPSEDLATLAMVAESIDDLRSKLDHARGLLTGDVQRLDGHRGIYWTERAPAARGTVAFLFPGQGSQTIDMGRELLLAFPEARAPFELADKILADRYSQPLSRYVFPPPPFAEEARRRQLELTDTHVAQPALGATEMAYLAVLETLGIEPDAVAGHSYGEFVALVAAGALDREQLLTLSEARGRFMHEAAGGEAGAMAAVDAAPDALAPLLEAGGVVAANLNAPRQTVISGPRPRVQDALAWCREHDLQARELPVGCAFHSPHVAGAQRRFAAALRQTALVVPRIPVYSNTTGAAYPPEPDAITKLLRRHLVEPVRFVEEIESMYKAGTRVFVEVGPRGVLTGLTKSILGDREHLAVAVDRPGQPGLLSLLHCLAALAAAGVALHPERLLRGRGASPLVLERLGVGTPPPPNGRWVVDGGSARPAHRSIPTSMSSGTPSQEKQTVISTTTNGAEAPVRAATANGHTNSLEPRAAPAAAIPRAAPSGDRVADVMEHYARVMQQFLETERDVMLGYLGTPRTPTGSQPNPGLPAITSRASSPPPASPAPAIDAGPEPVEPPPAAEPPPAVAESPTHPTPGNGHAPVTPAEIETRLLSVVSERTGYPAEMLSLDADLEGDLGIDSIKRVEIAGTFTQTFGDQYRDALDMDELTASRTLRAVIGVLEAALGPAAEPPPPQPAAPPPPATGEAAPFEPRPVETERIDRFVVHSASAPAIAANAGLAGRGAILIVDDEGSGLGEQLSRRLGAHGEVVLLRRNSAPRLEAAADELAQWCREEHGGVKALIQLPVADEPCGGLSTLFVLAKALHRDLAAAAEAGGAAVLAVSRLDGAFGLDGEPSHPAPGQRALAGFLKTLALEWPSVRVKAVDLDACAPAQAAPLLTAELMAADGLVEVGYRDGRRTILALSPAPTAERPATSPLKDDDVVLVTGGARGITAEVALALAERRRVKLVVVGRTPADEDERPETQGVLEIAHLRRALIGARERAGEEVTPALVEEDCRRILRLREARANLARLAASSAQVEYLRCDVRDRAALTALLHDVYDRYGRIDGVVHGAGLIEDRLVADKTLDSLERVMATKAGSAQTLADTLRLDSLRFAVLFGSVSGRFGNRGQADYAAASESLAQLAHELSGRCSGRVVAIDWGPWRGTGMVTPMLAQQFARRGVALIDVHNGCRLLIDELSRGQADEVEVVIGAARGISGEPAGDGAQTDPMRRLPLLAGAADLANTTGGALTIRRSFRLAHDRYLADHRVDGRPVVPFAVAMELMAESATLAAPGRPLAGLRRIRLLKGVVVPEEGHVPVTITATPRGDGGEVKVAIAAADGSRVHYRSLAEMREQKEPYLRQRPVPLRDLASFPMTVEDAYRELLFHGPLFQGIAAVEGLDERGAVAQLRPSTPELCVAGAAGAAWMLDPVLLDSALQVQVVWARMQWGVTLLPAEIGSYDRVGDLRPDELVRHELRIRPESAPPLCNADHWFYGADGRLLATLGGVVGVGTQALNRLSAAPA